MTMTRDVVPTSSTGLTNRNVEYVGNDGDSADVSDRRQPSRLRAYTDHRGLSPNRLGSHPVSTPTLRLQLEVIRFHWYV